MKAILKIKQATSTGYVEVEEMGCFNAAYPSSETRRGRVIDGGGIAPTLTAASGDSLILFCGYGTENDLPQSEGWWKAAQPRMAGLPLGGVSTAVTTTYHPIIMIEKEQPIFRRFTPREVYRLIGVGDADIDKLLATDLSRTSHYKLAGNSIVVDCLAAIFKNLFSPEEAIPNSLF